MNVHGKEAYCRLQRVKTADGQEVRVHMAIWSVYFVQSERLSLSRTAAIYLLRFLYGELTQLNPDLWLSKQPASLRDAIVEITAWIASGQDGFEKGAVGFV